MRKKARKGSLHDDVDRGGGDDDGDDDVDDIECDDADRSNDDDDACGSYTRIDHLAFVTTHR